ncbi:IS110 family transposase [Pseudomonas cavernicola]|uniref:IS110 family transposase n=1 Tax=Pseudomonas cavernicola TaxID=2320866 RepID=A0A418XBS6_9PSED|nr:IS110 family transposase [Pseudomonas cavernicola]RJG09924.1 IS110 family transposase [Pseudomonas cavernicola]
MSVFVGVDVGAKTVALAWRKGGRTRGKLDIQQTPEGHAQAVERIKALEAVQVVMEATGVYYLDLAVALSKAGIVVSVINPKSFHHFAQLKLAQSKTDPLDAALLAEYAERMTPAPWTAPDTLRMALRDIGRQINRLTATRTQAKNRLHALRSKRDTLALLIEDEVEAVERLDQRIERLSNAAQRLIAEDAVLNSQFQHLLAAKGVGVASAIALLAELSVLPQHLKAPQVSRYAGLDIRLCQSGSSVNKASRLSKAGNAYLRSALYMPALSAVRHDPNAKAFYLSLQRRGKKKIQAVCAVMRKYLTGLWACIQLGEPFDSSKLFSKIHLAEA